MKRPGVAVQGAARDDAIACQIVIPALDRFSIRAIGLLAHEERIDRLTGFEDLDGAANPAGDTSDVEHLRGPGCLTRAYYEGAVLDRMLDEHLAARKNHEETLWTLLNLEIWHRTYRQS